MSTPDSGAVRSLLATVGRRLKLSDGALGASIGFIVAAVFNLAGWPGRGALLPPFFAGLLGAVETGVFVAWLARRRRRSSPAAIVERTTPESRNLLFTAGELAAPLAASPAVSYANALVLESAASLAARVDPARVIPLRRRGLLLAVTGALWIATVARATGGTVIGRAESASALVDAVEFTVTPPGYTGLADRRVKNPERISALVGSRIAVSVSSNAASVVLTTADSTRFLAQSGRGTFAGTVVANADGFIALEPRAASGEPGVRRLVGLTVVADSAPRVRIVTPGRDLLMPDGRRAIDIAIDATDDIALASLALRFTRVSGSGERFAFKDGDVPLDVTRARAGAWTARAHWPLDSLALEPGDMVVYRAVATDTRPGAPSVESDAFIAEVTEPGGVAAAGFAIDPDQERYALSQQMVIVKTERLFAKRAATPQQAYADEAADIASEQRRVRAEFVFILGGEMTDGAADDTSMTDINEEEEANREDDLSAGREANLGRVAVLRATRAMSLAARALTAVDVPSALTYERAALAQLERAFSRSRIILRALAERERLDSTRRLTGDLGDAVRARSPVAEPSPDVRAAELRAVLGGIMVLARGPQAGADARRAASALAERVLRLAPADPELQGVASALSSAAAAMTGAHPAEARAHLGRAAATVNAELIAALPASPPGAPTLDASRTRGALVESLRRDKP